MEAAPSFSGSKISYLKYKAPRRKQRGINCAFTIRWLSASLRSKKRGIKPEEIKKKQINRYL
jgi:hypothetical protein